jgi:D-3-phosphoglycerate dehydrogenase
MKVLFIDSVHPVLWDGLVADGHGCVDGTRFTRDEILDTVADYQGVVIRSRITLDKSFFDRAVQLRFIARSGAGMENIDLPYAKSKGVHCLNSPEGNRDAVGEHALGMLLMLLNRLGKADREVRQGGWNREANRGSELGGKTVGLIGYGNMGRSFARRLAGMDCEVIAFDKYLTEWPDPNARRVDEVELFAKTDILSLHVPLTEETRNLVDVDYLKRFTKNIRLINTARGGCVSLDALSDALRSGKVMGACLDVLEFEDSSFEHFSLSSPAVQSSEAWRYLVQSDDVVLSPHIAGWTHESYYKLSEVLLQKIRTIFHP